MIGVLTTDKRLDYKGLLVIRDEAMRMAEVIKQMEDGQAVVIKEPPFLFNTSSETRKWPKWAKDNAYEAGATMPLSKEEPAMPDEFNSIKMDEELAELILEINKKRYELSELVSKSRDWMRRTYSSEQYILEQLRKNLKWTQSFTD